MPVRVCVKGCQCVRSFVASSSGGMGVLQGHMHSTEKMNPLTRRDVPQGPKNMPPGRRVETPLAGGTPVP